MNSNDLNQLLVFLTAREGAMISFSREDVEYLNDETDIQVYTAETEDVSINRMQEVREKFKQQTEFVAGNFQHCLFLIEMNPEHQLLTKELQDFFDGKFHKTLKWELRKNSQITSLRITGVFSRKSIGRLKDLLNRYQFEDIIPHIQQLSSQTPIKKVNKLYESLKFYEATPTDKSIRIASRFEDCYPKIDMNACVLDEHRMIISSVADYDSLSELTSMAIYIDEDVHISEKEVLAGLLLEAAISVVK